MDTYFVVEADKDGMWLDEPEYYDSKSEAIEAAKKLHESNPKKIYDVWEAEIIKSFGA